jgi:tubulin--tyrosine ligase
VWLLKPASLNQGRGIEVSKNMRDIVETIQKKKDLYWVIQKYIERPFLYKQRKFDIRVWVLLNDQFDIYFYLDGYLRTSSMDYQVTQKAVGVHLTNQCLQVNEEGYGAHEAGNTLTFGQFQAYLDLEEN